MHSWCRTWPRKAGGGSGEGVIGARPRLCLVKLCGTRSTAAFSVSGIHCYNYAIMGLYFPASDCNPLSLTSHKCLNYHLNAPTHTFFDHILRSPLAFSPFASRRSAESFFLFKKKKYIFCMSRSTCQTCLQCGVCVCLSQDRLCVPSPSSLD